MKAIAVDDEIYMLAIDKELNYVPNDSELSAEIESKETIINNHYKEISEKLEGW